VKPPRTSAKNDYDDRPKNHLAYRIVFAASVARMGVVYEAEDLKLGRQSR